MLRYMLWRILMIIPLLLFISSLAFVLLHLVPGSAAAAILREEATEANIREVEARLGLDDPLLVQYGRWLEGLVRGDLGQSFSGYSVNEAIAERLAVTLSITTGGLVIAVVLGMGSGILAALNPRSWIDRVITLLTSLGNALPAYFLAFLLVLVFAIQNNWFPAVGYTPFERDPAVWLRTITLPSLALGIASSALISRQTRSAMLDVLQSNYIQSARAMGIPMRRIIWGHALRNAMIPVLTVIGLRYSVMLGTSFAVEQVFAMPGLGDLLVRAVLNKDIPIVQGAVIVIGVIIVVVNTAIDISYAQFDPKARLI